MTNMRSILMTAAALALAGCASTGVHVTEQQLQGFQRGQTTYAEVVGRLGAPSYSTVMADGSRVLMYSYGHYQMKATSLIPIVGMFAGGGSVRASAASFTFDQSGMLKDWSMTDGAQGVAMGAEAGLKPPVAVKN